VVNQLAKEAQEEEKSQNTQKKNLASGRQPDDSLVKVYGRKKKIEKRAKWGDPVLGVLGDHRQRGRNR